MAVPELDVNVSPGPAATGPFSTATSDSTPPGPRGKTEEVASGIVVVKSCDAHDIAGMRLVDDGGRAMR